MENLVNLSVGCLLEFDNKFLLLHRSNEDLWEPCKGHVEINESYEDTIKRELKEETNIENFKIINKIGLLKFRFFDKKNNSYKERNIMYFHVKVFDNKILLSKEHDDYVWLEKESFLEKLKFEDVKNLLKEYLEK